MLVSLKFEGKGTLNEWKTGEKWVNLRLTLTGLFSDALHIFL